MHSSMIRTVRFSGRLQGVSARGVWCLPGGCGVCPGVWCPPRWGVCPGRRCGVCLGGVLHLRPMDRILDTRLWKHYLSATTVADGNKCRGAKLYARGKHGQKGKEWGITTAAFLYYFSAGSTERKWTEVQCTGCLMSHLSILSLINTWLKSRTKRHIRI